MYGSGAGVAARGTTTFCLGRGEATEEGSRVADVTSGVERGVGEGGRGQGGSGDAGGGGGGGGGDGGRGVERERDERIGKER